MSAIGGRVALVTGANRGLGLEIARQLAGLGAKTIVGARDAIKGKAAVDSLRGSERAIYSIVIDVADPTSIAEAIATVIKHYGRLDILVNNAGLLIDSEPGSRASILDLTREQMLRSFDTNVLGAFHAMQAALPFMVKHKYGRIVNISSRAGQLEELRPGFPSYRVSKTALNSLTRVTAAEFQDHDIRINAMCPGWIRTAMGGAGAPLSAEDGAVTAIWLASLPQGGPTGGFFKQKAPLPW